MKIVFVVRALPFHRLGGLELHTHDLAVALAARGHEVTIVTSAAPTHANNDAPHFAENVRVAYLPIGTAGNYSFSYFAGIGSYTAQICKRLGGVDILHTQEFAGLFMRRPAANVARAWVHTVHGTMFSETALDRRYLRTASWGERFFAVKRGIARIALHPAFCVSLKRPDTLAVDSEFTRSELLRISPKLGPQIQLVPLGIDPARYNIPAHGLPPAVQTEIHGPLCVGILGRVQNIKGIPDALHALKILRERGVQLNLKIAGLGDGLADAQNFVQAYDLGENVEFLGRLAPDRTSEFLQSLDILLFPDRTQPAFGLVAVEAMAHGVPVIGARCGAIPEVVRECESGWLVDARSPVQIADLLTRLSTPPARAEILAMAMGAHRSFRDYTAPQMVERMEQLYLNTLDGIVY